MTDSFQNRKLQDSSALIEEKLKKWELMRDQGQILPAEELCEDCPEIVEELHLRIEALRNIDDSNEYPGAADEETRIQDFSETNLHPDVSAEMVFERLSFHDRGGLGEIYRAQDTGLSRDVALKFIRQEALSNQERRERFELEAKVTGQLDHPGIVPVMAFGQSEDGRPFYVMRFIRGENLDEKIRELYDGKKNNKLTQKEFREKFLDLLRHFVAACNTIAYAHKRGIVHFDIKPKNIMVGKYGETLVVDWGEAVPLAQVSQTHLGSEGPIPIVDDTDETSSLSGGATLHYIAPERLPLSSIGYPGPRSDIYSLGVSLYKLLTGREAFCGSKNEIIQRVQQGSFPHPCSVEERGKDVSSSLEAICLKAMRLSPADRYDSAKSLAEDIERWMHDDPVSAVKEGWSRHLARWMRRHRSYTQMILMSLLSVLFLSILVASFEGVSLSRERKARQESLRTAAEFASQTVAGKIEERLWILQAEAEQSELRQALMEFQEEGEHFKNISGKSWKSPRLQSLLKGIAKRYEQLNCDGDNLRTTDLNLLNARGRVVARHPYSENTVGKLYWHRDYFHGKGKELGRNSVKGNPDAAPDPVESLHQSVVFRNDSYHHIVVGFSTPIRDESNKEIIGVLVMQINLGRFAELDLADTQQDVILVNLEKDAIEKEADEKQDYVVNQPGLVLHHSGIPLSDDRKREPIPRYVSSSLLPPLRELKQNEVVALDPYYDPISLQHTMAAAAPVYVQGTHWDLKMRRLRWVVIVQDSGKQ